MNERLFITIPSSFALWGIVIMLVTLGLNREVASPLEGRDIITVHLISIAAKPAVAQPQTVIPPPKLEIKKPTTKPLKVEKPKPPTVKQMPQPQAHVETSAPEQHVQKAQIREKMTDNHGATVIYQPMPKIPDDLRREAFNTYAMARFHVAADGDATVELLTPSQNPRLNRLLLETLKIWRFVPATDGGRPVASTFDIRVRFAVE